MPTEEQCSEAVRALYRVRAVEKPPGPDGRREVWHQGSKGCELLSTVDLGGHIEEQELTLFKEVIYWRHGDKLKTGKLVGNEDVSSRGNILWDAEPAAVRLDRCRKAFDGYTGADPYLIHIRDAVAATLAGLEWDEHRVVTTPSRPGDSQENPIPPGLSRQADTPSGLKRLVGAIKKWGKRE